MDTTITSPLPPLAPDIAALLAGERLPEPPINLPSRDDARAEFAARIQDGAQKQMPAHVIAIAERLIFEARAPTSGFVRCATLMNGVALLSRQTQDAEYFLAGVCLMRGLEWDRDAGRKLREFTKRMRETMDLIDDQTMAAEDKSEGKRAIAPH